MTYKNLKKLIEAKRYEYKDILEKLDLFLMLDRITQEEYIELSGMLEEPIEIPIEENLIDKDEIINKSEDIEKTEEQQ